MAHWHAIKVTCPSIEIFRDNYGNIDAIHLSVDAAHLHVLDPSAALMLLRHLCLGHVHGHVYRHVERLRCV